MNVKNIALKEKCLIMYKILIKLYNFLYYFIILYIKKLSIIHIFLFNNIYYYIYALSQEVNIDKKEHHEELLIPSDKPEEIISLPELKTIIL